MGSLKITVSNTNYGFGDSGDLGSNDIVIGRFYPYQFELNDTLKQGHDSFTYMGQEFTASFSVAAQSKIGSTTTNYGLFDDSLLMRLNLVAVDDDKDPDSEKNTLDRLDDSTIANKNWHKEWSGGTASIPSTEFKFNRLVSQASPEITQTDGPYHVRLGLEVDNHSVDCSVTGCTDFKDLETLRFDGTNKHTGRKFSTALDMRYGRLKLDPRIETADGWSATVPLKAEYWDGSKFVINTDDNGTAFNGANFYRKLLESDPDGPSKVKLSGQGQLTNGIAELTASQNASARKETVLLKLRMGVPATGENGLDCEGNASDDLEYLHFNWFGEGDDNPYSEVTFGAEYRRGNDRVIFRGEPRFY